MPRLAALLSTLLSARLLLLLLAAAELILLLEVGLPLPLAAEISSAVEGGGKVPWTECVALGLSVAALLGLALSGVLLLLAPFWRMPLQAPQPSDQDDRSPVLSRIDSRVFVVGLLVALVIGMGLRWNLSGRSMWWDELWNFRENSHGNYSAGPEGELKFRATDWERATWYYRKPTHHAPMALAVKASLGGWRALTGAEEAEFSDRAARFPALLASALSIVGIGLLLRCWGHPFPGVIAALLLAVHPLHVRYGIDARGFAFVVPTIVYGLLALTMVVRTRSSQRGWLALFAFCLFLLMWSFPVGIWYPLGLVGVAIWYLRPRASRTTTSFSEDWRPGLRLLVACSLAGLAFFHLFLPNFIQSRYWNITDAHYLSVPLLSETWTQLCLGLPNHIAGGEDGRGLFSLARLVGDRAWLAWILRGALTVLSLVGIARLFLRPRRLPGVLVVSLMAAAVLYLLSTHLAQQHYYPRYLIHLLPVYAAGLGLGLHLLGGLVTPGEGRRRLVGRILVPALFLAAFGAFLAPHYRALLSRPYAPVRDVAEELNRLVAEENAEVLGFGHGAKILSVYRPGTPYAQKVEDAAEQLSEFVARSNGRPGYVFIGHLPFNQYRYPEAVAEILEVAARLQEPRVFRGLEPDFTYRILRVR